MSSLSAALVGGVAVLALALSAKPLEAALRSWKHARRRAWWRRRRAQEAQAFDRQRAKRIAALSSAAPTASPSRQGVDMSHPAPHE